MKWWWLAALAVLVPVVMDAAEYLTVDDTTKSFLAELLPCSGGSNAVTYDATAKAFGCNSLGLGPGGTNTASNLGGGLANYDSVSGTDLRFNTFWATDFDLAANLLKIDDTKWATDAQVSTAIDTRGSPWTHVVPAGTTGADIATAITSCGSAPCQVDLAAGTYTDVCLQITRDQGTRIIGKGVGVTILKPFVDLDDCTDTDSGNMIQVKAADNIEIAYLEMDGDKEFLEVPTCTTNFCGRAIVEEETVNTPSVGAHIHHIYIHDFASSGMDTSSADGWIFEHSTIENVGCNQDTSNSCGCGAGDPGDCRGWDLEPDLGLGFRTQANDLTFFGHTKNSTARYSTFGMATHGGIEINGSCIATPSACPDNNTFEDNVVNYSVLLNGANRAHIVRNTISNPGIPGGSGDTGVGVLVTSQAHYDILISNNTILDGASSGIVVKTSGPGRVIIEGNKLSNNCTDHEVVGNIAIWGLSESGAPYPRDLRVEGNLVSDNTNCTYSLIAADNGQPFTGSVEFIGGIYEGDVKVENADLLMRGLQITGDLVFDTGSSGLAMGNTVSGSTTNTGGVCIMTNSSTPIPSSCVAP